MAPSLTTEQKPRIVEWFLQTNSTVTVQRRFKNQTSARKQQQGIRWWRWWSSFAKLGMWQARKEVGASHVFARPTLLGPFVRVWPHLQHRSLCDSLLQKMRYRLRLHGAYFEPIYACIRSRSMSSSLWQLCVEKSVQGNQHLQQNPHTLEHIWFSDDAYLHLTGDINRQNVRFWGTHHPHQIHESTLHAQNSLGGVCGFRAGLDWDYVTGENYVLMLDSFFLPQLRQRRCFLHVQWFQQDGARPHTTPEVLELLHSKFQHRIVSNLFPQQFQCGFSWPPCCPDLNPCDYFLWGYLKDKVFSSAPRTLPELKERIKESCAQVTRGMLICTVQNFLLGLQAVRESKGLTSSMSATALPICEILILVCYFDTVFV